MVTPKRIYGSDVMSSTTKFTAFTATRITIVKTMRLCNYSANESVTITVWFAGIRITHVIKAGDTVIFENLTEVLNTGEKIEIMLSVPNVISISISGVEV